MHCISGGRPLVHELACISGSDVTSVMEVFLEQGVNLKVKDQSGMLPLYLSCQKCNMFDENDATCLIYVLFCAMLGYGSVRLL